MILRFKPNSKAEQTVRNLIKNREKTLKYGQKIIQSIVGVEPKGFGSIYFMGIIYEWNSERIGFDNSVPDKIDGLVFTETLKSIKYFKPNGRTKKGKQIRKTFFKEQQKLRTDSEPLNEFGIFAMKNDSYTSIDFGEDERGVWVSIPDFTFGWLSPHPDVFIATNLNTTPGDRGIHIVNKLN